MAKKQPPGKPRDKGAAQNPPKNGHTPAPRGAPAPPPAKKAADKRGAAARPAAPPEPAGMDEITAHLDRGWDLLQRGDSEGAQMAARQVLRLDADSPEGYTLQGAIHAAAGRTDEAIASYERAMELDPEYVDPLLYAAETYLWPLEQFEDAVRLCEQALDVAEEEDEFIDAVLLKAEAEEAMGDADAARDTLGELPPVDFPEVTYHQRAARTLLDIGEVAEAEYHYGRALERDPSETDAQHGLGLCAEARGDTAAMVKAFLQVRERDLREPPAPWGVSPDRFEELCTDVLRNLPERVRLLLENVPIVAADYPSEELVRDGQDPRMLGFFNGVPYPEKSTVGGVPHLDGIYLYQRNIERVARTPQDVEDEIVKTVLHETGHFFGLSEDDLHNMGLG